jgi:hypothetical protein
MMFIAPSPSEARRIVSASAARLWRVELDLHILVWTRAAASGLRCVSGAHACMAENERTRISSGDEGQNVRAKQYATGSR